MHHVTPHKDDGPVPVASWWALASCVEAITEIIPSTLILSRCYEHLHSHLFSMLINYIKHYLESHPAPSPIHTSLHSRVFNISYTSLPHQTLSAIQPLPSNPNPTFLHSYYIPIIVGCTSWYFHDSVEKYQCGILFLLDFPFFQYISIIIPLYLHYIPIYSHAFIYSHDIPTRFSWFSHCISIKKWLIPSQPITGALPRRWAHLHRGQAPKAARSHPAGVVLGGSFENIHTRWCPIVS